MDDQPGNNNPMIKAIFFDAAGILYTRQAHTEEYVLQRLQEEGVSTTIPEAMLQNQLELRSQANQGLVSHVVYWDRYLSLRGVINDQYRQEFISDIVNFSNNVQPIPGVRETLAELKRRGFLLGIITDTMYPLEWKMRRLEKVDVADLIDIVACSSDLGVHKPDPVIYSHALQQAHLSPGEAAFVGHLGIELQGAHAAGMVTISVDPDLGEPADYRCRALPEVLTFPIMQATQVKPVRG